VCGWGGSDVSAGGGFGLDYRGPAGSVDWCRAGAAVETGVHAVTGRLPAARLAALLASVTIDLDSTDVGNLRP
jgi:hypothetical protein